MAVLGLAVVVLGYIGYLVMLFVFRRFTYRTWLFDTAMAVGTLLAVVGLARGESGLAVWLAIGLGVAWFPVTRRELTLIGSDRLRLGPGEHLPSFAAVRADGSPITDRDVIDAAPALLVLYRGWWCPSSRALVDDLRRDHERMKAAGLALFAASVDIPADAAWMQEYVGDEITIVCSFPVEVLDAIGARDRRGAPWYDRLRFGAQTGDIAMPAHLVIDESGEVVYAFRARRVDERARPAEILASVNA